MELGDCFALVRQGGGGIFRFEGDRRVDLCCKALIALMPLHGVCIESHLGAGALMEPELACSDPLSARSPPLDTALSLRLRGGS